MVMHKAFESRSKAENMARNISNCLKCGGIFVASMTCASKILKALEKSSNKVSFGNSVFRVEVSKPIPKTVPDFGVKFDFTVGQNKFEEYLVQHSVLDQIMAKYGLVLEARETFFDLYFRARRIQNQIDYMRKMGVIRCGREITDNYNKVYLTMSNAECQAASLYEAVIFKKLFK